MTWRRPLTGVERWHWLLDSATVLNVVLIARVHGRFDHSLLARALEIVQFRYPHLRARISTDGPPAFVATDAPVSVETRPWTSGAWRAAAVEQADTPVSAHEGPLMRVVLLEGDELADLILTFSHAAADARSGAIITDDVLRLHAGEARPALRAPEVLDPPTDEMLGSRWAALVAGRRNARLTRRMQYLRPRQNMPTKHRSTGLIDAVLDAGSVEMLARRARAHGTTVHGALCASMLQSIREEMRKYDGHPDVFLGCDTCVDLRRHTELRPAAVGNLLSHAITGHRVHENTLLWDLAAEVSESSRAAIRDGDVIALAQHRHAASRRTRAAATLAARTEKASRWTVTVANLGRLDFYERYGDLRLERLGFVESTSAATAGALGVCAATTADYTTLNFTFAEQFLGEERAQRIVADTLARLQEATST